MNRGLGIVLVAVAMVGCGADGEPAPVGVAQEALVNCGTTTGSCPSGYTLESNSSGEECEQMIATTCPPGYSNYVLDYYSDGTGDACTSPTPIPVYSTCPAGYVYEVGDVGHDHCIIRGSETDSTCPSGYAYRSGHCTATSQCCGDGFCDLKFENSVTCPADCGPGVPTCNNDGACEYGETHVACPTDCPNADTCATLAACPSGSTRIFVQYTQDVVALCNTHHICNGGGSSCRTGDVMNAALIGVCVTSTSNLSTWCIRASVDEELTYINCH
jgi:hypothetical protein